mmetsp:Transcript_10609/g.25816  ORF Transcript_10609/g.25816 Transcript_10609/m.25816 type:complete len:333 (-) Transcript_10609:75-1073(-)
MTPWPSAASSSGEVRRRNDGSIASVQGMMNYQENGVEKVVTRRDEKGTDQGLEGASWAVTSVELHNARGEALSLDGNGVELRSAPVAETVDYYSQQSIVGTYFPHCEQLIKEASGAAFVKAFDYNVRSAKGEQAGRKLEGGSQIQAPATLVHGDYTLASAPRRFAILGEPPKTNDVLRDTLDGKPLLPEELCREVEAGTKRWGIINVWRPITEEPVQCMPLACVDSSTTSLADLITFEIHYADRIGENYFSRPNPAHRWLFFPSMERTEAMLLKQWDSHGTLAQALSGKSPAAPAGGGDVSTFVLHSAFKDPSSKPDAPDRESIEVRCIVVW